MLENAYLIINECIIFLKKVNVRLKIEHINTFNINVLTQSPNPKKHKKKRKSKAHKTEIKEFEQYLVTLFNIALACAFDIIKIEKEKKFLENAFFVKIYIKY